MAATAGADRLIKSCQSVETAGASVNMVCASVAGVDMQFAEESGVVERRCVIVEAHQIEILSIGGVLVCRWCCGHVPGAGSIPLYIVVSYEIAAPACGIDSVANVGGKR